MFFANRWVAILGLALLLFVVGPSAHADVWSVTFNGGYPSLTLPSNASGTEGTIWPCPASPDGLPTCFAASGSYSIADGIFTVDSIGTGPGALVWGNNGSITFTDTTAATGITALYLVQSTEPTTATFTSNSVTIHASGDWPDYSANSPPQIAAYSVKGVPVPEPSSLPLLAQPALILIGFALFRTKSPCV
jgi:hypothetical protein